MSARTPSAPPARPARKRAALAGLLLLSATALIGSAPAGGSAAPPGGKLRVDTNSCGTPGERLPAGPLAFSVTNDSKVFATLYLISTDGKLAYAEIPWLGPGKTLSLATTLTGGQYAVRCVFSSGPVLTSGPVAVVGTATGAVAGYQPMGDLEMTAPVKAYRAYVRTALPELLSSGRTLDADVARGDLAAARTDWLTAHLDYERLGAAYSSFGDFDQSLNGLANGLPQGVDTPGWTGFFALEHGLWHGWGADRLRPVTQQLVTDIDGLVQDFPSEDTDPGDLPLRAHEILENALQSQLGGIADYGSGTTLATLDANVQGTEKVLDILAPLIRPRDPGLLDQLNRQLPAFQAEVTACRAADGSWTPSSRLATAQRQRLDGDLGRLLEELAVLPNLLTPRNHA
ncbi:EfeM/EfeO family lipoprotein [Kitasatospora sp. GP82]|uniref:EfeM/EfeO family lipoprotein n=1 Tax=Kitasatospora sp. GP82 TaxID=3035089 RepID=UPI00247539FC|nr:EfeM/EfeO family lipoprotein [Kitasatospora sp. GP82]MDH6125739.1 iron uptake system EfeUOB component EfeO/EfeM [Kitasatospora sp. GP82]